MQERVTTKKRSSDFFVRKSAPPQTKSWLRLCVMRWGLANLQTCRRTELLQVLGVTTTGIHSHVGSQALGEDRYRLVHVFSWHLFPKWSAERLSTHQLSYASAGVYDTFPAWCPRCDSLVGSNLESLRTTQSSQWTRLHSVSSAWHSHTETGRLSWLKQHNFVVFRRISTKLGDKVCIWLFDSHVKFHAKILTAEISTKVAGGYFLCSPGTPVDVYV